MDPKIIGIVNITKDSFSDGGKFLSASAAIAHARQLTGDGANYLELGPASSNPDAAGVSSREQIERLTPVLAEISADKCPISIDATDSRVLEFAIDHDVAMLNDVRGFADRSLHARLADCNALLVVVHSLLELERATRDHATPDEVLSSIDHFFERRLGELINAGIDQQRLIVDPGMGFFLGNDPYASVAVLQRIPEIKTRFGLPVMISVSRKSFLRTLTGRTISDIAPATLAAELYAANVGADYLRTHDVAAIADGLKVTRSLNSRSDENDGNDR